MFSYSFSTNGITSLRVGAVRVDNYTLTNPLRNGFKPYMKVYMLSVLANLGNATTMFSNAVMYFVLSHIAEAHIICLGERSSHLME